MRPLLVLKYLLIAALVLGAIGLVLCLGCLDWIIAGFYILLRDNSWCGSHSSESAATRNRSSLTRVFTNSGFFLLSNQLTTISIRRINKAGAWRRLVHSNPNNLRKNRIKGAIMKKLSVSPTMAEKMAIVKRHGGVKSSGCVKNQPDDKKSGGRKK